MTETIVKVASRGLLISGQVIQSFDPDKNRPEIIRADQIFIGEGRPRDFVIYRSPSFFERARSRRDGKQGANWRLPSCPEPRTYNLGESFDRLVLVPAVGDNGGEVTDRWSVEFWGGNVTMGKALDLLIEESELKGRFQTRPPKSRQWGDCMECGVPYVR
ncbi:hypothetical protein [Sphingopyxis sp. H115]|uniref:hypothetical protein n=1 Tax=Sphingopyxis sp. H115 TaxID=1759073 RepID=UPI00128F8B2B|nr:hypothetical protein [Sphingopyxis sp. H115]